MKTFFDSSAFAKRYVEEKGSDRVERLCQQASAVALSVLCVPEVLSAFNRLVREGALTSSQYRLAKESLVTEVDDVVIVNITPSVVTSAVRVLESSSVRAMDALNVGCALQYGAKLFVSSDGRQIAAAERAGLRTNRV